MKLVIQGKNIEITDSIRDYVRQKIDKAVQHFQTMATEVDVHLSVARNPRISPKQTAEVTIYMNGAVVRAEESSENLYASIDLVADKITRQLKKYKEKRKTHTSIKAAAALGEEVLETVPDVSDVSEVLNSRTAKLPAEVVRTKYFAMPPMTVEQALEQLDLVGHDFYVFRNIETNEINVIYERNHGGCGVIQPRNTSTNGHNGHHINGNGAATLKPSMNVS
jgi:putative sigma-54 modulation protein